MRYVHKTLYNYQGPNVKVAQSAETAKLGPRSSAEVQHDIKAGRLKGQLFACEYSQCYFLWARLLTIRRHRHQSRWAHY